MRRSALKAFGAMALLASSGTVASAQQPRGMMGMRHDSTVVAHMPAIHTLIMNHDRIARTVTNLSDGVRTVTESDDPALARRIREHVIAMHRVLDSGTDPGLPHTSPALRAVLRAGNKIRTTLDTTASGILVVQTSADPAVVAALQQHAQEVTEMVRSGHEALHRGMKHRGSMMHGAPADTSSGARGHPHPQ